MRSKRGSARVVGLIGVGVLLATTACVEEQPAPQPLEELTIVAPNLTVTYGDDIPSITPTYDPYFVQVVGLTCTTPATSTSNVGTYPIVCSGGSYGSTEIHYVDGSVTITPAPLTITASSGDLVPGDPDPVISPIYDGLKAGDTAPATPPTCSTDATAASPPNVYDTVCTGAADPNYDITYVNGTMQVAVGRLTVTAPDLVMTQGEPVPTALPSYSGWLGDDVLQTGATCRPLVASTNPPAGEWPIRCGGASDTKYVFDYVDGTLTVKPAGYIAAMPSTRVTRISAASDGTTLPNGASYTLNVEQAAPVGFANMTGLTVQTSNGLQVVFCDTAGDTAFFGCSGGSGTVSEGAWVTTAAPTDFKVSSVTGPLNPASVTVLSDVPESHRLVPTSILVEGGEAYVRYLQAAFVSSPASMTVGWCATTAPYNAAAPDCDTLRINVLLATPLIFGAQVSTPLGNIGQQQVVWVGVAGSGLFRTGDAIGLQIVPASQIVPARQIAPVVGSATVVNVRNFMSTVPIPAGTRYVGSAIKGGDARTNADPRLAFCEVNDNVNCWAQTGGPFASTSHPYVQTSIGTTAVPGGVAVTLPSLELALEVTAPVGTNIRTGVSQFQSSVTANAGIFTGQEVSFWGWPSLLSSADVPPVQQPTALLNGNVVP